METIDIKNPASVEVATLLYKPSATVIPVKIDYVGFEIENQFVLGYGLDYNGYGRNHNCILIKVDEWPNGKMIHFINSQDFWGAAYDVSWFCFQNDLKVRSLKNTCPYFTG